MKNKSELQAVFSQIQEIAEDTTVPRNVKSKMDMIKKMLETPGDLSIQVSKALNEIEDISNDTNMQAYTRTQIWNLISLLEKV